MKELRLENGYGFQKRCKGVHCVDLGESFRTDSYSNKYLLAKFGFDTAENEPCNVCPLSAYRSPRCDQIDFLLVSGDDTFVILENLREYLDRIWTLHGAKERPSRPLYIGNFFRKAKLRFSNFRLERIFF